MQTTDLADIVQHARPSAGQCFENRIDRSYEVLQHDDLVDGILRRLESWFRRSDDQLETQSTSSLAVASTIRTAVNIRSTSRKFLSAMES
jgi:hypothetical protein